MTIYPQLLEQTLQILIFITYSSTINLGNEIYGQTQWFKDTDLVCLHPSLIKTRENDVPLINIAEPG
jgi:hypothetical protein